MLRLLPQLFYETPDFKKVLVDGLCCIVHKKILEPAWQKEGYVSAHAITLVLRGSLRVEDENGLLAHIGENQMIFVPKGMYKISDILPEGGVFEAIVFFFDEALVSHFIDTMGGKIKKEKCMSHMVLDYTPNVRLFTESVLQMYGDGIIARRELTRIKLFELLHLVTQAHKGEGGCFLAALRTLSNKERKGIRTFMNANFSKPLSIEDYAYLSGRSLSSFRRDFKRQFGISPKQWLIEKRLEKAHDLLSTKDLTVAEVVAETGYENISHFIKAFHQKYGISPKQFLIRKRKEVLV